ncbi:MAG: hypothetical protein IKZ61_04385 [Prevotella sp.]|nr:hypothetical protein [Prevotella sp.]
MARFIFDNIEGENIILEFKCKKCFSLTKTGLLDVPEMDLDNLTTAKRLFKHECQCGACYSIEIYNGLYNSYGIIQGLDSEEEDVFVHEIPDVQYNKDTIYVDTINTFYKIESIINSVDSFGDEERSFVYGLLFTNLITVFDSFIKIYTEPIILSDNVLVERFSNSFDIRNGDIEEKKQKIRHFYSKRSFQTIATQKKLFKEVFNIEVDIDDRIKQYVAIRDVIIHRNAIDPGGYIQKINKNQLLAALEVVKSHVSVINMALFNYETD